MAIDWTVVGLLIAIGILIILFFRQIYVLSQPDSYYPGKGLVALWTGIYIKKPAKQKVAEAKNAKR
jgi:hypothetical protein